VNIMNPADRQAFHLHHPGNGNAHDIGAIPDPFNSTLDTYSHLEILRMVVFYNETFGIEPQDDLADRIMKFRRFLTEF
jgi:hypothetical protein